MNELINKVFTSKKGFPKCVGTKDTEGQFVKVGEKIKITEINNNEYKILNLSLNSENAWRWISQEELDYILRKGKTK